MFFSPNPFLFICLGVFSMLARGEAGLAKTLLFGRATPEGVFGLVRGQDLVFLLDARVADTLRAPLWGRAAGPPGAAPGSRP